VPISIKHADVGGCSNMTRVIMAFVRQTAWLVDLKVLKRGPRMVSSFCKDHNFGVSVPMVESRRMLTPQVHSEVTGMATVYIWWVWKCVPSFCCIPVGNLLGGASVASSRLK
jgi:hypothetical protein